MPRTSSSARSTSRARPRRRERPPADSSHSTTSTRHLTRPSGVQVSCRPRAAINQRGRCRCRAASAPPLSRSSHPERAHTLPRLAGSHDGGRSTLAAPAAAGAPKTISRAPGELFGPLASTARYIVYAQPSGDDDGPPPIEELDLRTHRKTTLVAAGLPALGVGATAGWWCSWLHMGMRRCSSRSVTAPRGRVLLSTSIVSSVTSQGGSLAWGQERAGRQRVLVRSITTHSTWVAADFPRCEAGKCYRIDYVTLAHAGVTFDRRAQRSRRRRFAGGSMAGSNPLPSLATAAGSRSVECRAFDFVLTRGWFRWDFAS